MAAGKMRHRVRFFRPTRTPDQHHGTDVTEVKVHECAAQMIYRSGRENGAADGVQASGIIKVKIYNIAASRALLPSDVMRDRDNRTYNIRAIDPVTDPVWVWIDVEYGVPTETDGAA